MDAAYPTTLSIHHLLPGHLPQVKFPLKMVFPTGQQPAVTTESNLIRPCLTSVETEMQQHLKPGMTMTLVIQSKD